jgi:hypothetical protein
LFDLQYTQSKPLETTSPAFRAEFIDEIEEKIPPFISVVCLSVVLPAGFAVNGLLNSFSVFVIN